MIYRTKPRPIKSRLKRCLKAAESRGDEKEADAILLKVRWQLEKQKTQKETTK